jgi:hypothetical protein
MYLVPSGIVKEKGNEQEGYYKSCKRSYFRFIEVFI